MCPSLPLPSLSETHVHSSAPGPILSLPPKPPVLAILVLFPSPSVLPVAPPLSFPEALSSHRDGCGGLWSPPPPPAPPVTQGVRFFLPQPFFWTWCLTSMGRLTQLDVAPGQATPHPALPPQPCLRSLAPAHLPSPPQFLALHPENTYFRLQRRPFFSHKYFFPEPWPVRKVPFCLSMLSFSYRALTLMACVFVLLYIFLVIYLLHQIFILKKN